MLDFFHQLDGGHLTPACQCWKRWLSDGLQNDCGLNAEVVVMHAMLSDLWMVGRLTDWSCNAQTERQLEMVGMQMQPGSESGCVESCS